MKLKIATSDPDLLRVTLASIIPLRKFCVFRFTPETLHIISASLDEPQAWCKLQTDIFDIYDVESTRQNVIAMEINIDPLYQILRAYQRTNSHNLLFHLQKKTANKIGTYITNSKSAAFLSVFYDQQISMTSSVQHTFRIPIRLLKKDSDDRIQEPRSGDPALLLRLSKNITYLYKRIDRYKKAKHITLTVTKGGELSINIDHELRDVSMVWKKPLPIPAHSFDDVSSDSISLTLKLRDWKKGAKIAELSKTLMMMFLENQALVLHAFMDDEKKSEVLFYAGAFNA